MDKAKSWGKLTPSQRLWLEVFGVYGLPKLDEGKVLAIVDRLPQRERMAVRLRFGFEGKKLTLGEIGERLNRADRRKLTGVSREIARLELKKALRRLGYPKCRKAWEEAIKRI